MCFNFFYTFELYDLGLCEGQDEVFKHFEFMKKFFIVF
jgi:hypothetical protein